MNASYNGFIITYAKPSGGKAGKGRNRTSTIQVYDHNGTYRNMLKHFRYVVGDEESENKAIAKAKQFIDSGAARKVVERIHP